MESQLDRVYELSMKIGRNINEATVDDLLELVQSRDALIEQLKLEPSLSDRDRSRLTEIKKYDVLIVSRMADLMAEASQGLDKITRTRVQKQSYEKMYAGDSYFIDRKE